MAKHGFGKAGQINMSQKTIKEIEPVGKIENGKANECDLEEYEDI